MKTDNKFQFGDIVLISFPFTDFSGFKKRPCVVLKVKRDDVLVCFMSSKIELKEASDMLVIKDKINGLVTTSLIKTHKLTTLHQQLIISPLGTLSQKDKNKLKKSLLALVESF